MKTKRTSLNDIAKALNVSKATVSFVLNGKGDQFNISKEKQRLIKEKAKELSYVPNFFAKSLRQGETKTIGLVLPDISNPFYAEICKTIQEKLYDTGYNTFIVNTNDDVELEKVLMRELIQRSIDGMIIAPSNNIKQLIPILLETHIPVVFTDRPGDENADFVGVDNRAESEKLINSFTKKPKRLSALVPYPENVSTIQERIEGTKEACEAGGVDYNYVDLPEDQAEVDKLIQQELDAGTDSFIALNNKCTLIALSALNKAGVRIPEDVRLISFDDSEAFQYMNPPISALRQPIVQIGLQTVDRMYERLKKSKSPGEHFILECDFQKRESH
ncbi:LacI family transcriptional regulator [Crocinitomicaceae bacterium]|nr:LacI family transcriptional regulator [Crocinitomicaceae bacterium]